MMTYLTSVPKKNMLLFVVILLAVFGYLGLYSVLHLRPCSVHMWAMCDRASVARNYAQDSMNFFRPRVHFTQGSEGVTGLEFPLVNYIAAICYKLFGFSEFWYRLTMLVFLSAGLISAFSITWRFTQSFIASASAPFLLIASPVLTYYAASFIPDTAALGLTLCGWYFFFSYLKSTGKKSSFYMTVFFALAALIKITSLISVVVVVVVMLLHKLWNNNDDEIKHKLKTVVLSSVIVFILTVAWYKYAAMLSRREGSEVFLMQIKPPQSFNDVLSILDDIKNLWLPFYFSTYLKVFIALLFFIPILFIRKVNRLLFLIAYGQWAGCMIFFYLMMVQFIQHDYYIITLLPAVFFQFLLIADLIVHHLPRLKIPAAAITILLLVSGMQFNRGHQEFRYDEQCWLYNWSWIKDYHTIEAFVKETGIKPETEVISIADPSPDIALYFLNLKGWSISPTAKTARITEALTYQPKYFITNDSTKATLREFSDKLHYITKKGSVYFFSIKY